MEFALRAKRIVIMDYIVEADSIRDAVKKVLEGTAQRGEETEESDFLHPKFWEIMEL